MVDSPSDICICGYKNNPVFEERCLMCGEKITSYDEKEEIKSKRVDILREKLVNNGFLIRELTDYDDYLLLKHKGVKRLRGNDLASIYKDTGLVIISIDNDRIWFGNLDWFKHNN